MGLDSYIDFIVTSEEAGAEKPNPHLFDICVEKAVFSADEFAFIGDSLKKDVEGSAKSGLKGIWYTQGKEPKIEAKFPAIKSFENVNIEELLK